MLPAYNSSIPAKLNCGLDMSNHSLTVKNIAANKFVENGKNIAEIYATKEALTLANEVIAELQQKVAILENKVN